VAVGDFKTREMLARIRDLYGSLPAGPAPRPVSRAEPEQRGERRVAVEGHGQTAYVQLAYHAPSATDPEFYPMVALDSILAGASSLNLFGGGISNKSSRLYKALVETELAASVGGSLGATLDPYLYTVTAVVRAGRSPEEVERALDEQVERIIAEPVSGDELAKALKQARAMFAYSSESVTNQGFWLGYTEIFDTHDWFEQYLGRLSAVTAADVQRVAAKYLARRNRTVGHYVPTGT
jgi:zinc protease